MKTYAVTLRPRETNCVFSRATVVMVSANNEKDARDKAIMRMREWANKDVKCVHIVQPHPFDLSHDRKKYRN